MTDAFLKAIPRSLRQLALSKSQHRTPVSTRRRSVIHASLDWWFRSWLGLLLLVALTSSDVMYLCADEGTDDYKVAVGLFGQSRWQDAAEQFRKFLTTYEKHEKAPLGRFYLGLSLLNLEDYKTARDEFRRFAEENKQHPKIGQARFRIAESSYFLDDFPTAKVELEAFLNDYPNEPLCDHALPYLGDTQLRLDDPATALKTFDRAIDKYPKGKLIDDAKFGRARSLESLKRFDDAAAQYQELVTAENSPRAADALFHLGAIHFERKQYPDAISVYTEFVKKFPQNPLVPNAQLNTGFALFHAGKYDDAVRLFGKVAKDPKLGLTATYWQGRGLKSLGDYSKAAEVLKNVASIADKHPLAEAIVFEQAVCERRLQHPVQAREFFEEVLKRFPKGDYADDSLHHLIEMSIEVGDLADAEQFLERFHRDYSQSPLRLLVEMLHGRLNLAQAGMKSRDKAPQAEVKTLYESAARRFEHVMKESSISRAKQQARYYLALTYQLQDNLDTALELIAPLVDEVVADRAKFDFADPLVLQADCYWQRKEFEKATESAAKYLELAPKGRQAARALSIQATSAENLNNTSVAKEALSRLIKEFGDHPTTLVTMQQFAEAAENRKDWATSGQIYETLVRLQKDPDKRAYAVRGIALSMYWQEQYAAAAETFAKVIKEFPKHELTTECAYYRAESLMKNKQSNQALEAFRQLFESYPENEPAKAGAETEAPLEFYYKAGRWVVNILVSMNNADAADAAYDALLKRFPEPADLDVRLKDWALLNFDEKKYDRSDEIWRRLLKERPESSYANDAKLYLAESDLLADKLDNAKRVFEELVESDKCKDVVKERALYQLVVLAVDQQRWSDVHKYGVQLRDRFPASEYRHYVTYSEAEAYLAGGDSHGQDRTEKDREEERAVVRKLLTSLQAEAANDEVRKAEWFDRVWVLLAELNLREKKYEEVETVVEDLKQRDANSPFLYQAEEVLGRSFKQRAPAKFDEARAAFKRVLSNRFAEGTETAAKAQFLIGDTYAFQEKWDDAFIAYQKVYSIYSFPEWQAEALFASAGCDERRNKWKQAAETYKLVIAKFPKFSKIEEARSRRDNAHKKSSDKAQ